MTDQNPPKDTFWPASLKIRDTGIYEDGGRRIHTTAGMGYPRKTYFREDVHLAILTRAIEEALKEAAEKARNRIPDYSSGDAFESGASFAAQSIVDTIETLDADTILAQVLEGRHT